MNWENLQFAYPGAFALLLLLPLLAWAALRERQRAATLRFPLAGLLFARRGPFSHIWWLPWTLRILALGFITVALARPQLPGEKKKSTSVEGIDIVVALDLSTSMEAADFRPKDRIHVAKEVLDQFIQSRTNDRIGLVVFAGEAYTQAPLTLDYSVLRSILKEVRTRVIEDGTAIGNALATATNRLRDSDAKSKVVVLITDGDNNAGQISPIEAAQMAASLHIKVFTILVGKGGMVPFPNGTDIFGNPAYTDVEVDVNPELLQQISDLTGAKYYRATDRETLSKGLNDILDKLDKSKIEESGGYTKMDEAFGFFLLPGLCLLALELLLGVTRLRSFP
ncbi:MAG: VWA domain-containing protein [Deltaproteobacteria bacterium]|nr:VWA domain-containing protein [Deltaproteobacteria bacterium]